MWRRKHFTQVNTNNSILVILIKTFKRYYLIINCKIIYVFESKVLQNILKDMKKKKGLRQQTLLNVNYFLLYV